MVVFEADDVGITQMPVRLNVILVLVEQGMPRMHDPCSLR